MSTWQLHTSVARIKWVRSNSANYWHRTSSTTLTTMRLPIKHPTRSGNSVKLAIDSSRSPREKNFPKHESSQQNVSILRTNASDARNECAPTAYVPQVSFGVQNVSDIILHAPKTILQHPAELSRLKGQKNGMPIFYLGCYLKLV